MVNNTGFDIDKTILNKSIINFNFPMEVIVVDTESNKLYICPHNSESINLFYGGHIDIISSFLSILYTLFIYFM